MILLFPFVAKAYIGHRGTIGTETWGPGTHYVTRSLCVTDNQVLTIQPGAVVKFAANTQMTVYGTLRAGDSGAGDVVYTSREASRGKATSTRIPCFSIRLSVTTVLMSARRPLTPAIRFEILTADYSIGELVIAVNSVTAVENDDIIWITDGDNSESDTVFGTSGTTVTI